MWCVHFTCMHVNYTPNSHCLPWWLLDVTWQSFQCRQSESPSLAFGVYLPRQRMINLKLWLESQPMALGYSSQSREPFEAATAAQSALV